MTTQGDGGGANVIPIERAFSKGQKRRNAKLIAAGRPRDFSVEREANGRRSRRKQYQELQPGWFAPKLLKEMYMHPVDALHKRGAITQDQRRAAFQWLRDREDAGLPTVIPATIDLSSVPSIRSSGEGEKSRAVLAARAYHDVHRRLESQCGVFGRDLAFRTIIQGQQDEAVTSYWNRLSAKMDPNQRQQVSWAHLKLAFEELEVFYAAQPRRREKREEAA